MVLSKVKQIITPKYLIFANTQISFCDSNIGVVKELREGNDGRTSATIMVMYGDGSFGTMETRVVKPAGETTLSQPSDQVGDQVAEGDAPGQSGVDPRNMSYDERAKRGDMLRNAPAVDVNEGVITSTKELSARKAAEKWWDENVAEPAFYDTKIGEVEISRNSVESSLAHRYGQAKLDALTSLIEGFENAVYLGSMPDGTRHGGVMNHYFAYPINYKGERCYVFCRAMHDANKNRLYVHEVFIADRIKKGDTLQTAASQLHGGIALYKDILANVLDLEPTSASEDRNSVSNSQENAEKSGEKSENEKGESRNEKEESTPEIQEPRSVEEDLDNGDKRITNYNSRGEVATVAIERDGKVVSVDSYDEGVLFEHTEYDGNGKATSVTRYDKSGNAVGTQVYEDGKEKTPMQKLADRILDRTEEKRRIPLRERARELEAQVGVKANIIESLDEVKNREARKKIAAGEPVAGWYSGGQVYLYMPNIKDKREIELTYVHEVVAHHGVKKLLGERFGEFLDGVWNMMSEADRARMLAYVGANENPTLQDMRAAADEYVAELAEKMNLNELEQSTWEKIVDWFKELLENIGFENLTKEDIESMLKASYSNLKAESGIRFRKVDDPAKIAELEAGEKIKTYRAMALIDGKLYPPMSSKSEGVLREPSEIGVWEEAEENPGKAKEKNGKYYFTLTKDNGKSVRDVAYNPYLHSSTTMLNDQFKEAQSRDNLVVVEMEIPTSELTSGYKADKAHDTVGTKDWKAGTIQGQLTGTREVVLSRWGKPVRIVPVEEVAENIKTLIEGQVEYMPTNVVTPQQRKALEDLGVKFVETNNNEIIQEGKYKGEQYSSVYGKKAKRKASKPMTKEEARQMVRELVVPFAKELREEQETRFRTIGGNSGYVGYSMSKRAAEAREEGRYPKTDFKKEYGVRGKSFDLLQKAGIIYNSEWHHTSKFGNRTDFYSWDEPEFAEYYAANKKRIDKAINEVEKLKPEYNEFKAIDKYLSEGRSQSEVRDLVDEDLRRIEPAEKAYNDARSKLIEQLKDEFYDLPEDSGTRFRITPEMDAEYMSAVENGDMVTAERLVKEAAKLAMPDTKVVDEDGYPMVVYHGSEEDFNVFDKTKGRANMDIQGMFFSPWDDDARGYGSNVRAFYLNITKPANESTGYKALNKFQGQNGAGIKAREYLVSVGYDGVNNEDQEFVAFDPNQIKSADPVTYDNEGNVIPLSERFNEEMEDIRFRMGSRVDARMAEVTAHFEGKQLTAEQQAVVDVFGGKADNLTISVKTKDGNERRVVMRQGNEMGAGAKHSLFRHFGMNNNEITADDILLIPEILANGEHVEKKRGKKTVIEYKYTDNNGVEYTVLTEIDSRREAFANFYTNRKASSAARKTRSEEARDIADDASEDKGSDNSSNSQEGEARFSIVEDVIEQQQENEVSLAREAVTSLGEKLNSPVKIMDNLDSVPENRRNRKGWFDPKTGEVVVVMPNLVSSEDAVQTVLHEAVGYKGLSSILGERFNELLDGVYKGATPSVKRAINDRFFEAIRNGRAITVREATERVIADSEVPGVKEQLRGVVRDATGVELPDGELRYLLWKNVHRGADGVVETVLDRAKEAETGTGDTRFRRAETFRAVDTYNKNVKGFKNKLKEGWYDEMRSIKVAQEAIEKELGKELMDSENVYLYANHIPSINKNKKEVFDNKYLRPFTSLLESLYEKEVNGKKLDEKAVERYTNAKHGIERNREMSVKNALTEVQDGKKVFNENAYKSWAQERDEVRKKNRRRIPNNYRYPSFT